ncbi:MAG: hypothetical protein M1819_003360 [Sarea resinae]|nr:MAG: hypothetical protein M1819_003360 [Sarea resinae]
MQAPPQTYPSPSTGQIGEGVPPFFSNQQRLPSPDNLQLSAQISRNAAPTMTGSTNEGQEMMSPTQQGNGSVHSPSPAQLAAQGGMDANQDPNFGDPTAPRKRSKVSRACDECRRKKIRCDATSESGLEQCSSCKRVGTRCQFSRVPMKRGPSKGYIKELADRLNTLENSIQPSQHPDMQYGMVNDEGTSSRVSDGYSPPLSTGGWARHPRKRTHSDSDALHPPAYAQTLPQRPSEKLPSIGGPGWPAQDPARQLPPPASGVHPQTPQSTSAVPDINHISSGYRPQLSPNSAQSFWRHGASDPGRRESLSLPYESSDLRPNEQDGSDALLEWDDKTVEEYYRIIHPTFPLLANSKARLRSRLANCPVTLREAFLEALYSAVRSFPSSNLPPARDFQNTRKASDLIAASQFESAATRTMSTNLIFLQTMILMALEADNHGPATMKGQLGPPRAVWLGAAVGLAYALKLHAVRYRERFSDGDPDSDEKLARRDWLVLVILDRWHASSTSSPLLIPDSSVELLPVDQVLLGDSTFHLARLSCIVGHLASIFVAADDIMSPSSPSAPLIGKLLHGEIERFRESVDALLPSLPLVHLSYWHVRLLTVRHTLTSEPHDLLAPALRMAAILDSPNTPVTPLNHHFAALTALTLAELADIPETKEGAWNGIKDLVDALDMQRGYASPSAAGVGAEDALVAWGWDSAIRDLIVRKKTQVQQQGGGGPSSSSSAAALSNSSSSGASRGGLQHLADLAVGESGGGGGGASSQSQSQTQQQQTSPRQSASGTATTNTSSSAAGGPGPPNSTTAASGNGSSSKEKSFDPTALTRYGYLAVLVQGGPGEDAR